MDSNAPIRHFAFLQQCLYPCLLKLPNASTHAAMDLEQLRMGTLRRR